MAELYAGGLDAKTIGAVLGLHRTTVTQYLREAGVPLRRRGLTDTQLAEAIRLYSEGWSGARLGERYDCNPETVRQTLKRAGVTLRPRHGWAY